MEVSKPVIITKLSTCILLAALGLGSLPCYVYAQPEQAALKGGVVDDSGMPLGIFEVHPLPNSRANGFPYWIEVKRSNGYRWFLTPLGIQRPTDGGGGANDGPLIWGLDEYVPQGVGKSIDRNHPNRTGEMTSNPHPEFKGHVEVQLAFRPVPEPKGANWIYSAQFQIVHFVSEEIMSRIVSKTGRYNVEGMTSLELFDSHNVITGSILIGGRKHAIHAHAYGSLVLGTIDGTTDPDAVRTHLKLSFDPEGEKITGSSDEMEKGGRIIAGTERSFVAMRSVSVRAIH